MWNKKILCSLLTGAMILTMAGCTSATNNSGSSSSSVTDGSSSVVDSSSQGSSSSQISGTSSATSSSQGSASEAVDKLKRTYDYSAERVKELEDLYTGANVPEDSVLVKMTTSMGEIELRLFPQYAPKAVENFVTHAKNGYYEGTGFHRILDQFMIQGGDPKGDGTGGESIWDGPFEDEFSDKLYHFRGAISMANAGTNSNGSQFFIVQADTATINVDQASSAVFGMAYNKELQRREAEVIKEVRANTKTEAEINSLVDKYNEEMKAIYEKGTTAEMVSENMPVFEQYLKVGGTPHLDGKHTVFGYVTKGMDIVDQIAKVELKDPANGVPAEKITLEKIEVLA